ncbi:F-box/RNI-like/FBD-like domains-containing protein [Raphanus sativus]|uniref:F-box/LRR-repeat protein At1g48400-like n=1 Tax=Raphanus sativus TaxID=3726 RepID=A0A9W3DEV7_RAPSA|nr:F-box/LRR-repeat protein At1g48400-like [Raphanus sativus]KAJ4907106.1 F-box/RNI-like/FBD-like domains-containing protein [Raphanus sativus]
MRCRDSISKLPDEILGKILSLVPTKVAASTSVLSKRWRNLMVLVDNICFDESMVVYPDKEEETRGSHLFSDFVEKQFSLLSDSHIIKKLSLSHTTRDCTNYEYYRWIWTLMERGLLELHLHASRGNSYFFIERELLTSNTLVKLTLSGAYILGVQHVFFPALKSLSILSVTGLDGPNFSGLIRGSPVLEELYILNDQLLLPCYGTIVQSASIKRLVVFLDFPDAKDDHRVTYCGAPNLVYLDYSSYVFEYYQFVDLDTLVEARLSIKLGESTNRYDYSDDYDNDYGDGEPIFGDVTNLVAGITSITTLHLSPDSLEAFHFCCESMPVFKNLLNLSIESHEEKGWQVMPVLLKSCPNLHTLAIKGLVHRVTNKCGDACACSPKKNHKHKKMKIVNEEKLCCLETCQVKVLKISEYGGSFQELKQMKHFLDKLQCLETVKVGFNTNDNIDFLQAKLLALFDIQFI